MTPDPVVRSLSSQLRTLARLAAQWADVLESTERRESGGSAALDGRGAYGSRAVQLPAAANSSAEPVPEVTTTAVPSTAPVIFACASCGARTVWDVDGYARPWPNAMCKACYAEHRMRRDEIQDAVVGYTGVR